MSNTKHRPSALTPEQSDQIRADLAPYFPWFLTDDNAEVAGRDLQPNRKGREVFQQRERYTLWPTKATRERLAAERARATAQQAAAERAAEAERQAAAARQAELRRQTQLKQMPRPRLVSEFPDDYEFVRIPDRERMAVLSRYEPWLQSVTVTTLVDGEPHLTLSSKVRIRGLAVGIPHPGGVERINLTHLWFEIRYGTMTRRTTDQGFCRAGDLYCLNPEHVVIQEVGSRSRAA